MGLVSKPGEGNGKWKVESGKWEVESGKWRVESGEWEVESGKWEVGREGRESVGVIL